MSKERLEEILDDLPYSLRHSGELEPLIDYAKDQTEQVQELENEVLVYKLENRTLGKECEELRKREQELEKLVVAYQTELSIKDNANKRIKKQNKRYREALEQVLKEKLSVWGYHQIARKALSE